MKLTTCEVPNGARQFLAAVLDGDRFVDLARAQHVMADRLPDAAKVVALPGAMIPFLEAGSVAMDTARALLAAVADRPQDPTAGQDHDSTCIYRRADIRLLAPVPRPGKIIHTSVNFRGHLKELSEWKSAGWEGHGWEKFHYEHPTGFLQASSSVTGSDSEIIYPRFTHELDYEIELAVIIGRYCKNVSKENALGVVAGYTVFNDISARDIQGREHANNVILLGKSFDTSAPVGPWMLTADELPDPQALRMVLKVNGEVRQDDSTAKMNFGVRELVSWWSNITLDPGDIITSGSIPGVAAAMKEPRYLQPGDLIEATIEPIGTLVNRVVAEHQ